MVKVIHTGQALVDVTVQVPDLPPRGGNVMASSYRRDAGGAVNILLAAARAGAEVVHAGAHGTGPNGDLVRETLAAEGVRLSDVARPQADTGICVVMVEPGGERTFLTTLGAERDLSVAGLATADPRPGDIVCLTGYSFVVESTRIPLLAWLARLDPGVVVVLDPGAQFADLEPAIRQPVLDATSVWTGNADEARQAGGTPADPASLAEGETSMPALARAVASTLPAQAVVIVRDGAAGCVVLEAGETLTVAGFPQEAVDTNGAGDAHTGVLVAERALGQDWGTAARRANAAAAIKVTRHGPATAPGRGEVDQFLACCPGSARLG